MKVPRYTWLLAHDDFDYWTVRIHIPTAKAAEVLELFVFVKSAKKEISLLLAILIPMPHICALVSSQGYVPWWMHLGGTTTAPQTNGAISASKRSLHARIIPGALHAKLLRTHNPYL